MNHMKILIVDDEEKIANALAERLLLRGFDATPVYDGSSALARLKRDAFDAIVLDLRLPDIDGIEVLRRILTESPDMRVAILSGHGTEQDFAACLEIGAIACFHKPTDILNIIHALEGAENKSDNFI
jgi:DNA-binding response OmpR family regulator